MTTLSSPPLAPLLAELFCDADATKTQMLMRLRTLTTQQRDELNRSADPKALYSHAREAHLAVSPATGRLLYILARASGAQSIVEFGTSFGISTLHMAAAVRDNGGGRVVGSEFEASKVTEARRVMEEAGLADLVEIRDGDALETLSSCLPPIVDLLFLDGAKRYYLDVLQLVERRFRNGTIIIADNAGGSPAFRDYIEADPRYTPTLLMDVSISRFEHASPQLTPTVETKP